MLSKACERSGILLGYRTSDEIVVVDMREVPDSKAHRFGYTRRRAPAQRLLDAYLTALRSSADVGWVGDFHSHTANQPAGRTFGRFVATPATTATPSRYLLSHEIDMRGSSTATAVTGGDPTGHSHVHAGTERLKSTSTSARWAAVARSRSCWSR